MIENKRCKSLEPQGFLICPVCQKEFEANDDTKYFISGGYTCSWKCFLKESKERDAIREVNKKKKNNQDDKK